MQSSDYSAVTSAPFSQRLGTMAQLTRFTRRMSLAGQRSVHSEMDSEAMGLHIAKLWTGQAFIPGQDQTMWIQDSLDMAAQLHSILEGAGIPYMVTGGVASSTWGEPRATRDLDLVASIGGDRTALGVFLEGAGYVVAGLDSGVVQITHQQTIQTADLHVAQGSPWELEQFERRRMVEGFWVISPEDLVLNKLRWGRGKSEKQNRDIQGILETTPCDVRYLKKWAKTLGLSDLLEKALAA